MVFRSKKPDFDLSTELEFEEQAPQLRAIAPACGRTPTSSPRPSAAPPTSS